MSRTVSITIDLTSLFDHLTGVERYAVGICSRLIRQHPEHKYVLIFRNEIHSSFSEFAEMDNVQIRIIRCKSKLMLQQAVLPRALKMTETDYYYFPSFPQPWFFSKRNCITTIHDISDYDCCQGKPFLKVLYCRIGIRHAMARAGKIVTVSEFSRKRIADRFGIEKNDISVVYDGVNPPKEAEPRESVPEGYGIPPKYYLSLGTLEPRKNLKLLIKAYEKIAESGEESAELVLAGRSGWNLKEAIGENGETHDRIHITGFVEDRDLPALYRNAEAFIFPSKYEGFGLPPLEAMSYGTSVISSDAASMPEILGDAAVYFSSDSADDLISAMRRLREMDGEEKAALRAKGPERAKLFDWSRQAEKLNDIILKGMEK